MKRVLGWSTFCAFLLMGCATNPLPKDYSGPIATIQDSAMSESGSRAQFFYLSEVNGKSVTTVLMETRAANNGRGFSLTPSAFSRDLPAQISTLKLEARVDYGAPIQAMMNASTLYSAERTLLNVNLESNKTYVVKGILSADRKEVWMEELGTGKRVD